MSALVGRETVEKDQSFWLEGYQDPPILLKRWSLGFAGSLALREVAVIVPLFLDVVCVVHFSSASLTEMGMRDIVGFLSV